MSMKGLSDLVAEFAASVAAQVRENLTETLEQRHERGGSSPWERGENPPMPEEKPATAPISPYLDGEPLVLDLLDQDLIWRDRTGRVLLLEDLDAEHRTNVLAWLRRNARRLAFAYVMRPMFLTAPDDVQSDLGRIMEEPRAWIDGTALGLRLRELEGEVFRAVCTIHETPWRSLYLDSAQQAHNALAQHNVREHGDSLGVTLIDTTGESKWDEARRVAERALRDASGVIECQDRHCAPDYEAAARDVVGGAGRPIQVQAAPMTARADLAAEAKALVSASVEAIREALLDAYDDGYEAGTDDEACTETHWPALASSAVDWEFFPRLRAAAERVHAEHDDRWPLRICQREACVELLALIAEEGAPLD